MKGKLLFITGAALALIVGISNVTQAASNLFVVASNSNEVRRYDGNTGAPLGSNASGGGLTLPVGATLGPDGNLYVSDAANPGFVNRYSAASGAFIDTFVTAGSGAMTNAVGSAFGPDGNLYVGSFADNTVKRYNGTTGAFIDNFSGVAGPVDLRWGPSGDLYVGSRYGGVYRVNGVTGANLGVFAPSALSGAEDILFGPNGDLYLSGDANGGKITRFNGVTGALVGDVLINLSDNTGFLFDSNGNILVARSQLDRVDRYNATTGAFMQTLVAPGVGGPDGPTALIYIPEPSSASLIAAGAVFLAARRKRNIARPGVQAAQPREGHPMSTPIIVLRRTRGSFLFGASVAGLVVVLATQVWAAPTLSGAIEFKTDPGGTVDPSIVNNTDGPDGFWNLYVIQGTDLASGTFINDPNAHINVPLSAGTYTFSIFAAAGASNHFGLNLFFDDDNTNPGISVYAPMGDANFLINSSSTLTLSGAETLGAGSVVYNSGGTTTTLTNYLYSDGTAYDLDRVGPQDIGPDGFTDCIGQFTLSVVVPEPASAVGIGMLVMPGLLRRRARRSA